MTPYGDRELHFNWVNIGSVIPPLHRGCDLCASLVRPPNWPGRRWRQKGGRTVALVVQGWHIGRSDIAMDAMVAVKFWACSKQSHKGRRGGRSLTGRSKEAGWSHTHRRGHRMDAQWSAIGRPVKNANIVYQCERHVCLPCTTIVPPLADQWRPLSDYCGDHCASIRRPRQHLSHHGNGSAFTLPSLRDLLCHYSSFGRSRKAQGSCCSSYTETELSGFPATTERPNHFYGRTKVARRSQPCVKGALMARCLLPPSHCINQCWHIIKGVLWHSSKRKFTRSAHEFNPLHMFGPLGNLIMSIFHDMC